MIRSAEDVLAIVKSRGMSVWIDPGPPRMPMLRRPQGINHRLVTETLLDALKAWRVEILEILSKQETNGESKHE